MEQVRMPRDGQWGDQGVRGLGRREMLRSSVQKSRDKEGRGWLSETGKGKDADCVCDHKILGYQASRFYRGHLSKKKQNMNFSSEQ